jgi:hypothetical protein
MNVERRGSQFLFSLFKPAKTGVPVLANRSIFFAYIPDDQGYWLGNLNRHDLGENQPFKLAL